MAEEFVERVRYVADISDLQDKLDRLAGDQDRLGDKTESSTGRMAGAWSKLGGAIGGIGHLIGGAVKAVGAGVAVAAGTAIAMGPEILAQGAELEALGKKSQTVFEDATVMVETWASKNAAALGMTRKQLVGTAAGIGDLLKPMGFTSAEAATMSGKLMDLSGALSAWTGGQQSATEVADTITKAMLGERDGLKSLGISISEADVQARLLANGQDKLTGSALEQAKALVTQQLIFEKSTDAQKAWANGSMDAIKKQNEMKATLAQLKESLITGLYPVFESMVPIVTKIATWLGEFLPKAIGFAREAIDFFVTGLTGAGTNEGEGFLLFLNQLGMKIGEVVSWVQQHWPAIKETVLEVFNAVAAWVAANWPPVRDAIVNAFQAVVAWVSENWPAIKQTVLEVVDKIREGIAGLVQFVQDAWQKWGDEIIAVVQFVWPYVRDTVVNAIEIVRGVIKTVTELITGDWSGAWNGIKDFFAAVWDQIVNMLKMALKVFVWELQQAWNVIKTVAAAAWEGIKTVISTAIDAVVGFITGIPGRIASVVATMWDGIKDGAVAAKDWVVEKFDAVVEFVGGLPGRITEKVKTAFDGLKTAFKDAINWVIDRWNSLDFGIDISIPDWVPGIGGKGFKVPDIVPDLPRLHSGGVFVAPRVGGEGLALLRDGERITTAPSSPAGDPDWDAIGDRIGRQVARTLTREMRAA